jgi:hypothetical protein
MIEFTKSYVSIYGFWMNFHTTGHMHSFEDCCSGVGLYLSSEKVHVERPFQCNPFSSDIYI